MLVYSTIYTWGMLNCIFGCTGDWRGKCSLLKSFPPLSPLLLILHGLFGEKLANIVTPVCNHAYPSYRR